MGSNRRYPSTPAWHPLLDATEYEAGRWVTHDARGDRFALVDLVRRGGELGYRAVMVDGGKIIGYYLTLRAAISGAHQHYIRTRSVPNTHPLDGHRP